MLGGPPHLLWVRPLLARVWAVPAIAVGRLVLARTPSPSSELDLLAVKPPSIPPPSLWDRRSLALRSSPL